MRAKVKIFESDDNLHKLYYKYMNKPKCGYFKWWVPEMDDFNNRAVFEGNIAVIVDSHVLQAIEDNVKKVKTLIKMLQKPGFGEGAVNMMIYPKL